MVVLPANLGSFWRLSPLLAALFCADALVVGACIGGYLTTLGRRIRIYRQGTDKLWPVLRRVSRCEACGTPVYARHDIPVLSYLYLRGRCSCCHAKIPVSYPLNESLGAIGALAAVILFGLSVHTVLLCIGVWCVIALYAVVPCGFTRRTSTAAPGPESREAKVRAVRESNLREAQSHAVKERKALPLHDDIGPFPLYFYEDKSWHVVDATLRAMQRSNGTFKVVVDFPHWTEVSKLGMRSAASEHPLIPGADSVSYYSIQEGMAYGPFATRSEGFAALRPWMVRWSLRTLLDSMSASDVSLVVLHVRLNEVLHQPSVRPIPNAVAIGVWLKQLGVILGARGQGSDVIDGVATLRRYLVA